MGRRVISALIGRAKATRRDGVGRVRRRDRGAEERCARPPGRAGAGGVIGALIGWAHAPGEDPSGATSEPAAGKGRASAAGPTDGPDRQRGGRSGAATGSRRSGRRRGGSDGRDAGRGRRRHSPGSTSHHPSPAASRRGDRRCPDPSSRACPERVRPWGGRAVIERTGGNARRGEAGRGRGPAVEAASHREKGWTARPRFSPRAETEGRVGTWRGPDRGEARAARTGAPTGTSGSEQDPGHRSDARSRGRPERRGRARRVRPLPSPVAPGGDRDRGRKGRKPRRRSARDRIGGADEPAARGQRCGPRGRPFLISALIMSARSDPRGPANVSLSVH